MAALVVGWDDIMPVVVDVMIGFSKTSAVNVALFFVELICSSTLVILTLDGMPHLVVPELLISMFVC